MIPKTTQDNSPEHDEMVIIGRLKEELREERERAQKLVEALEWIKTYGPVDDLTIKFIDKALNEWNGAASPDRPCPHCGKELNRDRNLCCRECGEEVKA